jgi:hypothetical protein
MKGMEAACEIGIRQGNILLVRTSFVKWYKQHGVEDRRKNVTKGSAWCRVEGCEEMFEWLWDRHFAAVGGDSLG